ncbi:MAG TPA: CvpA family protein [Candidatus Krumholzibacteria bacterium]|nr:CvpA family protein [Candidatus Krumholzibacteria bacterium]
MTVVYVAMAVVVTWFVIEGVRQGVVRRLVEVLGLLVVFLFASRLAGDLEPIFHDQWGMPARVAFFGSWVVVIVGGLVAVRLLAQLSQKIVRLTITGWLDRAGGAVLGAVFGLVIASCALILLLALPVDEDLKQVLRDDEISAAVLHLAPAVYDAASSAWGGSEGFFEMIREHVEPVARDAAEQIRATVDDTVQRLEGDDGSQP